jgi:hypothetical protein
MPPSEAFVFVAGGTVQAGGGVYLERAADRAVLEHCRAGDFTYILTSRQMGKSSMMIRTAERLAQEDTLPVIIDLTELGTQTTPEQWYKGFLFAVQDQLGLGVDASSWWNGQPQHSFAHRFTRYLREVALAQRHERIVLFVDEIDTTLRLGFTDDFFAAIRFMYQNRAADAELERLSFVLIGVATPGDLIKDGARTPFNIGYRVELTDFTEEEAEPLMRHLNVPPSLARNLLKWILAWTGGHPYLTLRVVRSLAESLPARLSRAELDARVSELFLGQNGESDSNLQFVRDMLTRKAFDREAVLRTYLDIRSGAAVPDNEQDQVQSWLKLSGVVCRDGGMLRVRNAVYETVFDEAWAAQHLNLLRVNWRQRLTHAVSSLLVLVSGLLALTTLITIPLAMYAWRQKANAEESAEKAHAELNTLVRMKQIERGEYSANERKSAADDADPLVLREVAKTVLAESAQLTVDRDAALQKVRALEQQVRALEQQKSQVGLENARLADRLSLAQPDVDMPKVEGMSQNAAKKHLEGLRLTVRVEGQNSTGSGGTVLRQWPPAGTKVARGAMVELAVSDGNARVNSDRIEGIATDASGKFTKKLSPGVYEIRFEATGFATEVYPNIALSASVGAKIDVRLKAEPGLTMTHTNGKFQSAHGGFVEGTVFDPSGKGIPNIIVTFIRN